MLGTGGMAGIDEVRLAMERVRSGESDFELIGLPSGGSLTICRDETVPIGVRIRTPLVPGKRRMGTRRDFRRRRMLRRARIASPGVWSDVSHPGEVVPGGVETSRQEPSPPVAEGFTQAFPAEGQTFRLRSFRPTEERPVGYPRGIPFLPNLAVSISVGPFGDSSERARNAVWVNPPGPEKALEEIRSQLFHGGWEEGGIAQASTFMGHTRSSSFRKGEFKRVVVFMDFGKVTQIMLFETMEERPGH